MSGVIETVARGIRNAMPGIGLSENDQKEQAARGKELIRKWVIGGAALGGGVSSAVALTNYLKSLKEENDLDDPERMNDDTLYIPVGGKTKSAAVWSAPGLAMTGGVLSAAGSYAVVQSLYNMLQKKRRQKLLDEAQHEALTTSDAELDKQATASMTLSDLITGAPVAAPLLLALASGGVTAAALSKAFPVVKHPKSKYPLRIRAVTPTGDMATIGQDRDPVAMEEGEAKPGTGNKNVGAGGLMAAEALGAVLKHASQDDDLEAAALELMTVFTDAVAMQKQARHCITSDILNMVAKQGLAATEAVYEDTGFVGLMDKCATASYEPVSESEKVVAAAAIYKSGMLGPVVAPVAAAEYLDMMPLVKAACDAHDEAWMVKMAGLGALMHIHMVRPLVLGEMEKSADNTLLRELAARISQRSPILAQQDGPGTEEEEEDRDASLTSDVSGSMGEDNEGDGPSQDRDSDDESQAAQDTIDGFMEAPHKAPPMR